MVDELVSGVSIGLGVQPVSASPALDRNADREVAISEVIAAMNNVLQGC